MVQQPFGPQTSATTLALPAIVAGQSSQQQQQQSAYSPQQHQQDNFYPQQILKNATQQQYNYQQPRMNGLPAGPATNGQQNSPNSSGQQQQQPQDAGLYNRAPVYAPKPTYYTQQAAAAAVYAAGRSPVQLPTSGQAPFYQTGIQQQPSPAGLPRAQVSGGLSVRQMPMVLTQPVNLSPQQAAPQQQQQQMLQQQAIEQQQRQQQMQQLIMSYQQQQQLHNSLLHNGSVDQVIGQPTYAQNLVQQEQQMMQPHQSQQDARWNSMQEDQSRQLAPQQHQQRHLYTHQQPLMQGGERLVGAVTGRPSGRFSDRDSISTVSRFNQFDERRSITMRSQFTSAKNSAPFDKNFGFAKVALVALKRIVGLAPTGDGVTDNKHNLNRNLQMPISAPNNGPTNKAMFVPSNNQSSAKVTVIDSAENHYFNRKVFKYQLVIMRCICFLSAAFVLLSPVAMLLIPKMEHIFNSGSRDYSSESSALNENNSPIPSITHAVGLTGKQALGQRQPPYYTPQPQWRISECTSDCDGLLIGFVTRFIMLCIAYWAIFFRAQTTSLPRIDFQRCLLVSMAVLITLSYWLFFTFRLFDKRFNDFELQYISIVQFSLSMLESLILLHYLAVVLLELRSRKKIYCLKVVRSPDGESQYFSCGAISIQKCAETVLEKYHRQFKQYGQYKEQLLGLEDRLARNITTTSSQRDESGRTERSRPSSPANSHSGTRTSRRPNSRASRHHSRTRSPSTSPARERSRSQKRSNESNKGVKVYQVDLDPPSSRNKREEHDNMASEVRDNNSNANRNSQDLDKIPNEGKQQQQDNENSGDQSSDTTSKMKESSLETIRAANSTSDLISQPQKSVAISGDDKIITQKSSLRNAGDQQAASSQHVSRDETESVRSGRSRRSTSRHHSRHRERERERDHHHHKERSSSRAHDNIGDHRHSTSVILPQSDPLEEHERKLRRRKFRLLVAVQDAFQQIKRTSEDDQSQTTLDLNGMPAGGQQQAQAGKQASSPNQTARSLYPRIARSLQKYLRLTGQTGSHNLQSIYEHLSKCLLYKLSPRAFLEKFFNQDPVWQQSETNLFANCTLQDSMVMCPRQKSNYLEINSWSLVCDTLLSRQIDSGTFFVLKQGQVSLLVTVAKMPHLNLSEEVIDQNACRFKLDSGSLEAMA